MRTLIQTEEFIAYYNNLPEKIKGKFDYSNLNAISTEARQKLEKIQPVTLAQASRIPGVSPSDINAMLVLLGR